MDSGSQNESNLHIRPICFYLIVHLRSQSTYCHAHPSRQVCLRFPEPTVFACANFTSSYQYSFHGLQTVYLSKYKTKRRNGKAVSSASYPRFPSMATFQPPPFRASITDSFPKACPNVLANCPFPVAIVDMQRAFGVFSQKKKTQRKASFRSWLSFYSDRYYSVIASTSLQRMQTFLFTATYAMCFRYVALLLPEVDETPSLTEEGS